MRRAETVISKRQSFRKLACHSLLAALTLFCGCAASAEDTTESVDRLFEKISDDPVLLRVFLRHMPKGGDLHNHASGTPHAEEYLEWAADSAFCVTSTTGSISRPPCDSEGETLAQNLMRSDPKLYADLVDSLSVRELLAGVDTDQSGHNQFFASFGKFLAIVSEEPDRTLASVKTLAANDALSYVELMFNPGTIDRYATTTTDPDWDEGDLDAAFERFKPAIPALVEQSITERDKTELEAASLLGCDDANAPAACDVVVYYNTYGLRLLPNDQLFRHLALGFALIEADPRFLGASLVEPEDDPRAVENYDLHMRMIAYLKKQFPHVRVSLHAGELALGRAPSYAMRDHIRKAIDIAGSERIGHGVDIAWELHSRETLSMMATEKIAVEINLSSNDVILGVRGA